MVKQKQKARRTKVQYEFNGCLGFFVEKNGKLFVRKIEGMVPEESVTTTTFSSEKVQKMNAVEFLRELHRKINQ